MARVSATVAAPPPALPPLRLESSAESLAATSRSVSPSPSPTRGQGILRQSSYRLPRAEAPHYTQPTASLILAQAASPRVGTATGDSDGARRRGSLDGRLGRAVSPRRAGRGSQRLGRDILDEALAEEMGGSVRGSVAGVNGEGLLGIVTAG
jgi:hypothetical protein